jgi:dTDP-4-dehydrorhamnose reductase
VTTVLVTGAAGVLGGALVASAPAGTTVVAQVRATPLAPALRARARIERLDLGDDAAVEACLARHEVGAIIHAAARTSPADCEDHPTAAAADNILVPQRLAARCAACGLVLVHCSTDLVFDGRAAPYREEDPPRPISVYGRTKAAAEALVAAAPNTLIVRLPLMLGRSETGRSVDEGLRATVLQRDATLFVDEFRTPVHALLAARVLWELLETGARGIFHVAGRDRISRWELGLAVADRLGLPRSRLHPGSLRDFTGRPPRCPDVSLATDRLAARLGRPAPTLAESLALPLAGEGG